MRKNHKTICVESFKQELGDTEECPHEKAYDKVVTANIRVNENYLESLKSKTSESLRAYEQSRAHYRQAVQQWILYMKTT